MFKVSVKDFGPIIEGTVDLKPLTLFVGPSNAGKSYMAMLAYSLMKSSSIDPYGSPISYGYFRPGRLGRRPAMGLIDVDEEAVKAINDWAQSIEINPLETLEIPFVMLPEGVQRLVHDTVERSFESMGQSFSEDLQRCHGDISGIRSRRKDAARLQIGLEQSQPHLVLNFEEDQGTLRVLPDAEWDMSKSKFPIRGGLARSLRARAASGRSRRSGNVLEAHDEFLVLLMEIATATLFEKFPRDCYYLRASRQKRAEEGYAAADCLKSGDVSAYHFRPDGNSGGSRVEELPILPDFGIDEQEFAAVSEALYEETVSLQRVRANR